MTVAVLGFGNGLVVAAGATLWRTPLVRPGTVERLGRAVAEELLLSLFPAWAIDNRAAAALVIRTTGAGFVFFVFSIPLLGFGDGFLPGEFAFAIPRLTFSTASSIASSASMESSDLPTERRLGEDDTTGCTSAVSRDGDCEGEASCAVAGAGEAVAATTCSSSAGSASSTGSMGSTFSLLLVERLVGESLRRLLMTLGTAVAIGDEGGSGAS